jgi:O-antigen ligase
MDLISQLQKLIELTGGFGVIVLGLGAITMLFLALLGKCNILLLIYLVSMMFYGYSNTSVETMARLVRWFTMFMLALTIIRGMRSPGIPTLLFGAISLYGIVAAFDALNIFYAIQFSGLLFVFTLLVGPAISAHINNVEDIDSIMKLLIVPAGIWVFLSMISLGELRADIRFTGASSDAPGYVLTGGMLMPMMLFGMFSLRNKVLRYLCGSLFILILLFCALSGQRTGTFAGIIACLPLMVRFGIKRIFQGVLFLGLLAAGYMITFTIFSHQKQFFTKHFLSIDTTGRDEIWLGAIEIIMKSPWFGHGFGGSETMGKSFHNMYLTMWHGGGIFCLILIIIALVYMIIGSFRLLLITKDEYLKNVCRYTLGIGLGLAAGSFFEHTLASPSNLMTFNFIFSSILLSRTKAIFIKQDILYD